MSSYTINYYKIPEVGGTDTNLATADLTLTTARTHNLDGNILKFDTDETGYIGVGNVGVTGEIKIYQKSNGIGYINNYSLLYIGAGGTDNLSLSGSLSKFQTNLQVGGTGHIGGTAARLKVRGANMSAGTYTVLFENSGGQEAFRIENDRQTYTKRLNIKGLGSTSATTTLLVENSLGTELFKILDDGTISGNFPNFATADLTLTGNRKHDLDGNRLSFFGDDNIIFQGTSGGYGESRMYTYSPTNPFFKWQTSAGIYIGMRGNGNGNGCTVAINKEGTTFGTTTRFGVNVGSTANATGHFVGEGSTSATTTLLVENSSGTDLFKIDDDGGFALGNNAVYGSRDNVSIGERASATATGSIAIGEDATSNSLFGIAIGRNTNTGGGYNLAIGHGATNSSTGSAIGYQASTTGGSSLAIGSNATSGPQGVAVGKGATNTQYGVALGYNATTSANAGGLAIGNGTTCSTSTSMIFSARAYGAGATNSTSKTAEFYLNAATPTFRFGEIVDGYLNSTGNFAIGKTTGINEKLDVEGNITSSGQTYSSIQTTLTPSGTTETIDFDNGNFAVLDLGSATGDVTLTLSNAKAGASYFIKIIQGATARDVVFPSTVKFAGETAPYTLDVTATNDSVDAVSLAFDGTDFIANFSQNHG